MEGEHGTAIVKACPILPEGMEGGSGQERSKTFMKLNRILHNYKPQNFFTLT